MLFFGDYELSPEWQEKLPHYKQVIFDQKASLKNIALLQQLKPSVSNFIFWDHEAASKPAVEDVLWLQELVGQDNWSFPRLAEGNHIGLVWLKDSRKVILYNLLETENQGIVTITGNLFPIRLKALSFAILDSAGTLVDYNTAVEI